MNQPLASPVLNNDILAIPRLLGEGRKAEALALSERLLAQAPEHPDVLNAYACVLMEHDRDAEAGVVLERAVKLHPQHADTFNNLGLWHKRGGRLEAAAASFDRAIQIAPRNTNYLRNICRLLFGMDQGARVLPYVRALLRLDENNVTVWRTLATTLHGFGESLEALAVLSETERRFPNDASTAIMRACFVPSFIESRAEMLAGREVYAQGIERLKQRAKTDPDFRIDDPLEGIMLMHYYLAYHGLPNKELLCELSAMYRAVCPALNFTAPHCRPGAPRAHEGRLRIGVLSAWLYDHSVGRIFARVLPYLASLPGVEVVLLSLVPQERRDPTYQAMAAECAEVVDLLKDGKLSAMQQAIAARQLDMLIYTDVAMLPTAYFLAFARFAPVQMVLGGHPDTSGIDTMDYFISIADMEPPGVEAHYSEKLIRLPQALDVFAPPKLPAKPRSRLFFGIPPEAHLYVCPMVLTKIHPDFDPIVGEILRRDPKGLVVFMRDGRNKSLGERLENRIKRNLPDVANRVKFLNWLAPPDFQSFLMQTDVVLDPPHFGTGTTTYYTFAAGTPVVSTPGGFSRSRAAYYFYRLMGAGEECLATDDEDYVAKAVRLGTDAEYRARIRRDILANVHKLFDNTAGLEYFTRLLPGLARGEVV